MIVRHPRLQLVFVAVTLLLISGTSQAVYQFGFDIFTSNGPYHDDPRLDFSVVVSNGIGHADFTFYNTSSINSSLARIYFDDGSLLGISSVINSPGTSFSEKFPGPGNLPSGETIGFYADREFTIGAVTPPPENGVNPAEPPEWVKIRFNLVPGGTLEGVVQELITGELRVGIHIISIDGPPGSSESAILVPEPATLFLLAVGAAAVLRRRK